MTKSKKRNMKKFQVYAITAVALEVINIALFMYDSRPELVHYYLWGLLWQRLGLLQIEKMIARTF